MTIPRIVKQLTDSIRRSKDVFNTIIELDKSELHSDNERHTYRQFIYHFSDEGELLEDSQLYYYPPLEFRGYTTEELFDLAADEETCTQLIELEGAFEQQFDIENISHLRIDFSKKHYQPIVHPLVHFHFGAINSFRLALTKFPTPFMFTSLIARNFFKEEWEKIFMSPLGVFDKAKYDAEIEKTPDILTDSFAGEETFFIHHK